jgi:hypothetical protein
VDWRIFSGGMGYINRQTGNTKKNHMKTKRLSAMPNFILLLLVTGSFFITSCQKPKFETGITGNIEYGKGDCMPPVDESSRTYEKFKGEIYFIVKADLDNLGNGSLEQLKQRSISDKIKRGKLSIELPPNTYVVMLSDVYFYSAENTITITAGEVISKNFKFWKCTSS